MADAAIYLVVAAGAGATYLWRGLGVAAAGRLRVNSPAIEWFSAVAFALLAGLIARLIVLPAGALATTALSSRLAATAVALGVYLVFRRNLLAGVAAGSATLALLAG